MKLKPSGLKVHKKARSIMEVKKRGRNPHNPVDALRKQVETLAAFGVPQKEIARTAGIDEVTLRKYYSNEIETGATKANVKVVKNLFRIATGTGPAASGAAIFWCKTRLGWREVNRTELTGEEGGPIKIDNVTQEQRDAAVKAAMRIAQHENSN